ncbi:hypothetical protein EYC80_005193 [Monilinia laxa]|uniref:Uncharacterized protein n=1 Tax=Monilinia laxa TaxID=61186 RepID=A0A5N6KJ51_MONLA|nr:hypothetical protein EYC80_005193 [Monilinia laxa]
MDRYADCGLDVGCRERGVKIHMVGMKVNGSVLRRMALGAWEGLEYPNLHSTNDKPMSLHKYRIRYLSNKRHNVVFYLAFLAPQITRHTQHILQWPDIAATVRNSPATPNFATPLYVLPQRKNLEWIERHRPNLTGPAHARLQ